MCLILFVKHSTEDKVICVQCNVRSFVHVYV